MKAPIFALIGVVAAVALSVLVMTNLERQHRAVAALPPVEYVTHEDMQALLVSGRKLVGVLGTGSMAPYIPKGDPRKIVAYAELEGSDFGDLHVGDLVVYRSARGGVIHQVSSKDNDGWIVSGLNNKFYDATRVVRSNFSGRVVRTFVLKTGP